MPHDIHFLDGINSDFRSYSVSSVDAGETLTGRPYGGLSIMWRKSMDHICKVVSFEDKRILGLRIDSLGRQLLAVNVYLPYSAPENVDEYLFYIRKITCIMFHRFSPHNT